MTARAEHDPDPDSEAVLDSLVQASFSVIALLSRLAAAHDLSLTQLRVLAILRDHEPKIAELADHLGLERSSVSGLIDRSERRGLVRKVTSPDDARAVRVSLSPKGKRFAEVVAAEAAELFDPMTHKLNAAERRRLSALLTKLL